MSVRSPMLLLAALVAAPWTAQAKPAAAQAPALTLFERPAFQGAQITFTGFETRPLRPGFKARSAISTGLWTLCETSEAASRCQTVNGAAAHLKLDPKIVRPGVNAVALYEKPGLKGRRLIYSFASDQRPPFRPRSARTWGGPWSLCDSGARGCEAVNGVRANLDLDVAVALPGRVTERVPVVGTPPPPQVAPRPTQPVRHTAPSPPPPPPPVLVRNQRPAPTPRPAAVQRVAQGPVLTSRPPPLPPLPTTLPRSVEPLATAPPSRLGQGAKGVQPQARADGRNSISYICEDGRALTVSFDPRKATAVVRSDDEAPVVLDRTTSRRGFRYEGWDRSFYGVPTQATYQVRDDDPVDCWPTARDGQARLARRAAALDEPPPDYR